MSKGNREQILSLSPEDLLLDTEQFLACKWAPTELTLVEQKPLRIFLDDQVQVSPARPWTDDSIVLRN